MQILSCFEQKEKSVVDSFHELTTELFTIAQKIRKLNSKVIDLQYIDKLYFGDDFPDQNRIADVMYGYLDELTDVVDGEIDRACRNAIFMKEYIVFCREFNHLNQQLLEALTKPHGVDNETKKDMLDHGMDKRAILDLINRVRTEWQKHFGLSSFREITNKINQRVLDFKD